MVIFLVNILFFIPTDRRLLPIIEKAIADAGDRELKLSDLPPTYQRLGRAEGIVGSIMGILLIAAIFFMTTSPGLASDDPEMRSTALFVHSSGPQGPREGSAPFAARLREELGSAYEIQFPIMPAPEDPHFEPWSERLGEILAGIDQPVVVVGHSLGGSVALKHLSEADRRQPIAGLLLVAAPFWGEEDWAVEWALPEGWPGASAALPPTFLFHSRDDEEIHPRSSSSMRSDSRRPRFIRSTAMVTSSTGAT